MSASRAYLPGGRVGPGLGALSEETARIAALFARAGARPIAPPSLQPADLLLDIYGEDIRARAFIAHDPVDGELILRPDFTVPVALTHFARDSGAPTPARYAYCGTVWRRQEAGSTRPTEYLQAGMEMLGEADAVAADAEIFTLIRDALHGVEVTALTGDLSIALALIDGVEGPERRRAALRRHVWRPGKFRAVLEGFGAGGGAASPERAALLAAAATGRSALLAHIGARRLVGLRGVEEIADRAEALLEESRTPPIAAGRIALIEAALAVRGPSAEALDDLRALAAEAPALSPALDRMETRLEALAARGIDAGALPFDASFGRALEYYDGFVFEFRAPGAPHLPPLGGGGRYDALMQRLGGGARLAAVGGVVRPEALIAARGGGA